MARSWFVMLTDAATESPVLVNMATISYAYRVSDVTRLVMEIDTRDTRFLDVKETPIEVFDLTGNHGIST